MSQRSQVSRIVFVFAIGECVSAESPIELSLDSGPDSKNIAHVVSFNTSALLIYIGSFASNVKKIAFAGSYILH